MISNCGWMSDRWYNTACEGLAPSIVSSHIPYFHSFLCRWAYNMALPFFWVVVIDAQNRSHLMNSITSIGNIEPSLKGKWNISSQDLQAVFNDEVQNTIGCIFADGVEIPGMGMSVGKAGGALGRGGHLGSPISEGRSDPGTLQISFKETNMSFVDLFLKPWSVITSYKGLIADDGGLRGNSGATYWGGSIKANIHVYQLAKAGTGVDVCTSSVVRKQYHFYDAVPTEVSSDSMTMEQSGVNKRQTHFAYNYYTVSGNQGS